MHANRTGVSRSQDRRCWIGDSAGAGDGTRTHDILLGKQTLYQLSYTRIPFVAVDYSIGVGVRPEGTTLIGALNS